MYSGITRGLFPVVALERREGVTHFTVELSPALSRDVEIGASIGLDGVCLTVVAFEGGRISFEAIAETLTLSTLSALEVGRLLSVERSVRVGDELGGHDVFGHISGTGTIVERTHIGGQLDLTIEVPRTFLKYILPKGFVALDGSSLTVGEVQAHPPVSEGEGAATGRFTVHLIPETQRLTNFANKQLGDLVNVELDARTVAIVETVERVLIERGLSK